MIEIQTNQLKTRKKALIDGQDFTVRRFSNYEQLNLSQYQRRISQIMTLGEKVTEKDTLEMEDIILKLTDLFVGLFDDGGDQSKSKSLVAELSFEELGAMLGEIFKAKDEETTN